MHGILKIEDDPGICKKALNCLSLKSPRMYLLVTNESGQRLFLAYSLFVFAVVCSKLTLHNLRFLDKRVLRESKKLVTPETGFSSSPSTNASSSTWSYYKYSHLRVSCCSQALAAQAYAAQAFAAQGPSAKCRPRGFRRSPCRPDMFTRDLYIQVNLKLDQFPK